MAKFVLCFIFINVVLIRVSWSYTKCIKPETGKTKYGNSCTSNSQCLTEYCNNSKCSCPQDSFLDAESGMCAKKEGNIKGQCGYIVSPRETGSSHSLQWNIEGQPGTYVTFALLYIDDNTKSCASKFLRIFDGSTILFDQKCYRKIKTYEIFASRSSTLSISYGGFASDEYKGFRGVYYIRDSFSILSETFGFFASPGYPISYTNKLNYTWHISASQARNISVSVEGKTEINFDFVRLYEGEGSGLTLRKTFTDTWTLESVSSITNSMMVQFTSDGSNVYSGFCGTYQVYGVYGSSCSSSEPCDNKYGCNANKCTCSSSQYYDYTAKSCTNRVPYHSSCTSQEMCIQGFICSGNTCSCSSTQYYDQSSKICKSRASFGYLCSSSVLCLSGLTCNDGLCGCTKSQYYNQIVGTCHSRVSYNSSCTSQEMCIQGFICSKNQCTCSSTQYYDQSSRTCMIGAVYGYPCSGSVFCVSGLTCPDGLCGCTQSQYYNQIVGICYAKLSHGATCLGSEECTSGLVCQNSKCRCPTSQYYDQSSKRCMSGITVGNECTSQVHCAEGLECISNVCKCPASQYFESNQRACINRLPESCISEVFNVEGYQCLSRACKCSSTHFFHERSQTCKIRLFRGSTCSKTEECMPGFGCYGSRCDCSWNQYYESSTCKNKSSHGKSCVHNGQCLSPLICIKGRCICTKNMFLNTASVCHYDSALIAKLSNNSIIKTHSILLKWTIERPSSAYMFSVKWENNSFETNSSELYIENLSPGSEYNFSISTKTSEDDYYNAKFQEFQLSIITKQSHGQPCNETYTCSEQANCTNGVCVCLDKYFPNALTETCEPRLSKGYLCHSKEECKETMVCIEGRCGCQSEQYYHYNEVGCFTVLKKRQPCDPSIEYMCELPDLICTSESPYTLNYTCQQNTNLPSKENSNTVIIVAVIVGVVTVLVAGIIVYILYLRKRKKSQNNVCSKELQEALPFSDKLTNKTDSKVPTKNDYKSFPVRTGSDSSLYLNQRDLKLTSSAAVTALATSPAAEAASAKILSNHFNSTCEPEDVDEVGVNYEDVDIELYGNVTAIKDNFSDDAYQNAGNYRK
ncbi:deleted in malignant brain tumors 1 protein [Biomphalaria pfeifferi]|uniref:Deleted in malignant brain tumors 1 protein n=1 Tax=Biomphalaria pfeifferi TaxID=112525 RepID=A0AAD8F701_BIOPF|nr:deleted in malignant brain tumors 1 protein [Biomphalaria pfeifferi]